MYNEKRKMRYDKFNDAALLAFRFSERIENMLNKDISEFTTNEIYMLYKSLNMTSVDYLYHVNNTLLHYTQWCFEEGLIKDSQNHFSEIGIDDLSMFLNKNKIKRKYVTRDDVIMLCNELCNAKDKLLILGLFEGIRGKNCEDFALLKIDDLNNNELKLQDRTIVVSDRLAEYIRKCNEEYTYTWLTDYEGYSVLCENGYVIKVSENSLYDTKDSRARNCGDTIKRILKVLDVNYLKIKDIATSGQIDYVKRRCNELDITPEKFLYNVSYANELMNQYGVKINKASFLKNYKDLL